MLLSLARLSFLVELLFSPMGCCKNQKSRSRPRCRSFFLYLAPSVRVAFSSFATPLVRECYFCTCSLQMCCWRSGFSPPASIWSCLKMRLQIILINHVRFSYVLRAHVFPAQCLYHPSHSNIIFQSRRHCLHRSELPALEVSQNSMFTFPPSLPLTFFVALVLVAVHSFGFEPL